MLAQLAQLCDLPAAVPHGSHGSIPRVRGACPSGCSAVPSVTAGTRRPRPASRTGPSPLGKASGAQGGYGSQTGGGAAKAARTGTKVMYSKRLDSSLTLQRGIVWVPLSSGG